MLRSLTHSLAALLALTAPSLALDIQNSATPGNQPSSLPPSEIEIYRADRTLSYKYLDGSIGRGLLLNALPAGRAAIEHGDASWLSVTAPFPGAVARSHQTRAGEGVNVSDFGARCDNITDDTNAFNAALSAAASLQKPIDVPAGTCLVSGLHYTSTSYASQFGIRGAGRRLTRIKQIAAGGSKPVLTIGSVNATNYIGNIELRGITFDGLDKSQPSVVSYDLVRSFIWDVLFTNGSVGYLSYGGINNTIYADAINNNIGVKFINFISKTGGGYPNNIRWSGALASNVIYGLLIDGGRNIVCDICDIEGNGTSLGAASGGVYVGSHMGVEVGGATSSAGLTLRNAWFEGNFGEADVVLNSGRNLIDSSVFNSQSTAVTYDVHIVGGNYTILNSRSQFTKVANLKDEAGVMAGNSVDGGYWPAPKLSKASWLRTFNAQISSVLITAGNGIQVTGGTFRIASQNAPASSTAACTAGTISWDVAYTYVCVATNTWKRSALTTW